MIWRSTLVFLTSLTAFTLSVTSLQAKGSPSLIAQSPSVNPDAAVNTGEQTPDFRNNSSNSPLEGATSEEQKEEIKALQQELKERGYYNGPIDGIYGPVTAAAIEKLRGQQSEQSDAAPRLFSQSDVIEAPADPEASDAADPDAEDGAVGTPEGEANSVRINAENATVDGEDINIGDEVSPETGINSGAPNTPPVTSAPTQPEPSPGLGRLLWPGLALIAALGSFGIGFVLSNRTQSTGDDEQDAPWGAVPKEVSQPTTANTSLNGHTTANGTGSAADVNHLVTPQPPSEVNNSLPVVSSPVSATTRLAKVDVIDELVANLQVADPSKRRKAIWELGQRGNSSAVQHLVNSMVDADSKEKSLILAALSEIGIRSLKPMNRALAIALQDDNPDVRKNAIRDLTRVYDLVTQISQMLGHATEDEDAEVRRTAEWALEQLNRIREAPKMQSSLNTLEASRATPELLPDEVENITN
ncbi:hypothetical protein D0962_10450 [Leptolyngbyaceae cyanobacterium CCMR0082]|uniref:Peptidoglycan binding-like domain-containing protein n=1 Tax=Adonisia turfae CCMR0082 TaxID=2304604 RepID=A0A6M0S426_9CYAN|nr:hypothetical protein [Adonisia turfae CCMR0082]